MNDPKITYESWEAMGADVRAAFLEKTPQGRIRELLLGAYKHSKAHY